MPQTSVALGVLSVSLEDQIPAVRPESVRGYWLLWPLGGLPWPPAFKYPNKKFKTLPLYRPIFHF